MLFDWEVCHFRKWKFNDWDWQSVHLIQLAHPFLVHVNVVSIRDIFRNKNEEYLKYINLERF